MLWEGVLETWGKRLGELWQELRNSHLSRGVTRHPRPGSGLDHMVCAPGHNRPLPLRNTLRKALTRSPRQNLLLHDHPLMSYFTVLLEKENPVFPIFETEPETSLQAESCRLITIELHPGPYLETGEGPENCTINQLAPRLWQTTDQQAEPTSTNHNLQ